MLHVYKNVDMIEDVDSKKTPIKIFAHFCRGVVSSQSKLQYCVALSTIKVEYIVVTEGCKETLWMKNLI